VNDIISTLAPYWQTFSQAVQLQLDLAAAAIAVVALGGVTARLIAIRSGSAWKHCACNATTTSFNGRMASSISWFRSSFIFVTGRASCKPPQFVAKRDQFLADLSAAIDKGRLYFPHFAMDIIGAPTHSTAGSRTTVDARSAGRHLRSHQGARPAPTR